MEYNFKEIEAKWQSRWRADKTYKVETDPSRPKFYVLDKIGRASCRERVSSPV